MPYLISLLFQRGFFVLLYYHVGYGIPYNHEKEVKNKNKIKLYLFSCNRFGYLSDCPYMTPLHTRPKAYRNLFQANRVSNRDGKTEEMLDRAFDKETIEMIAEGHKAFWKKPGIRKPPYVSARQIGDLDTL